MRTLANWTRYSNLQTRRLNKTNHPKSSSKIYAYDPSLTQTFLRWCLCTQTPSDKMTLFTVLVATLTPYIGSKCLKREIICLTIPLLPTWLRVQEELNIASSYVEQLLIGWIDFLFLLQKFKRERTYLSRTFSRERDRDREK